MLGKHLRGPLLWAACSLAMVSIAQGGTIQAMGRHRADVDVSRYPWSAVGKLYNEAGASCSGVLIASDKILTAAHCVFNYRTRRFIPATALHFLVGYRSGKYAAHVRIASYRIGAGFDPLRYGATWVADWAVLTATESLPAEIEPLRLSQMQPSRGTKAVLVGYPQDRAHAMTADRDCELRDEIDDGRLLLHTCRGIKGYSGAPILVSAGDNEVRIAGIQIASQRSGATENMVAVPAQAIWRQDRNVAPTVVAKSALPEGAVATTAAVDAAPASETASSWDEAGFEGDITSTIVAPLMRLAANEPAVFDTDPFAVAVP
jgi:protease YdgD